MIGKYLGKFYLAVWNGPLAYIPSPKSLPRMRNRVFAWLSRNYVWIMILFGLAAIIMALSNWLLAILPQVGNILEILAEATEGGKPKDSENIRNLSYSVAVLLGAIAFAATVPFQLIRTYINERLARTTEQGHITDRINKAVEFLGAEKSVRERLKSPDGTLLNEDIDGKDEDASYKKPIIIEITKPNLEVRLGAIYALERIAQDSERDHIQIMEILCAYIRENSKATSATVMPKGVEQYSDEWHEWRKSIPPVSIDIQAVSYRCDCTTQ